MYESNVTVHSVVLISLNHLYWQIRAFIQKFYAFVDGVSQHHRDIDELLSKVGRIRYLYLFFHLHYMSYLPFQSLDSLLKKSIGETIGQRLTNTQNPTQIAQIMANLEHFQVACGELERSLTNLRYA